MFRSLRILSLCAVAATCSPATSQAGCFDWLFGCRSCNYCDPCGGAQTTYRPLFPRLGFGRAYYAGYAGYAGYGGDGCNTCSSPCSSPCSSCSPCATQYVPQTSYRACYVSVPVTTCQAVCATDPCTGCPVTVMRPVTTCVQQVRYTPVVTYRPVCPTPCGSPCGDACGGSYGSSYGGYGAAYGSAYAPAGSCCSGGAAMAPSMVAPSMVAPSMAVPPGVVPSTVPTDVPSTFREGSSSGFNRQVPLAPPAPRPALTTGLPQRTWTFRPVSSEREQASPTRGELKSVESKASDGWRAAKR